MTKKLNLKDNSADALIEIAEFIDHFNIHYKLLLRRYARFKKINDVFNTDIDVITYLDMIVVQIRAMCIESPNLKNNYTAQNLLHKVGENELADRIDAMLDEPFIPETDFTIKKALKTLADGFICHYDNFDMNRSDGLYLADIIEKRLRNPYDSANLDYIMKTIVDCLGEGLTIKLVNEEQKE